VSKAERVHVYRGLASTQNEVIILVKQQALSIRSQALAKNGLGEISHLSSTLCKSHTIHDRHSSPRILLSTSLTILSAAPLIYQQCPHSCKINITHM
jgi:hypothetical protein